jgi:hypothetical protein
MNIMTTKLTPLQAQELLVIACNQMKDVPSYRLGQAIFNLLPKTVSDHIWCTPNDFFYWQDEDKVMEVFMRECVEDCK